MLESEYEIEMDSGTNYRVALVAGAAAGVAVDVSMFPLDTVKTRLQSSQGFWKAGGFRNIYAGLGSAALGSAPTAAMFFLAYEGTKSVFGAAAPPQWAPVGHMLAASLGEVTACLTRVPVEVVKQRAQADSRLTSLSALRKTLSSEGFRGLYRGYFSTVAREIPFSFLQFPLWEFLKKSWSGHSGKPIEAWQSSICGALSGAFAAGLTTPLDVAKTRIILAESGTALASGSILLALRTVHGESGIRGLFVGSLPRMAWISLGGAIFLGVYDKVRLTLAPVLDPVPASLPPPPPRSADR